MKAFFKLNNSILDSGLTPNELKVAVCLYSCVFNNHCVVQIKQSTIAQKCGIKKIETVGNIICQLQRKGIIERVSRPHKTNGWLGTYIYKLKEIASKGFFKMKRHILEKLNGIDLSDGKSCFICDRNDHQNYMEVSASLETHNDRQYVNTELANKEDSVADNLISQALDNGELSSFSFTGQITDLSYFSQSDTMPLSAIRTIGDESIKEAVKQNFDRAAQQGLIELDGDNIRITGKGQGIHKSA